MSIYKSCRRFNSSVSGALSRKLEKRIDQQTIERWSATFWGLPRDIKKTEDAKPYTLMFPPPNVTGNLHLGHALTGAIQDALIRQRRMQMNDCIFIPGFDHAGLATQNIVEKLLWSQRGITRQELGRDKFVDLANDWKEKKRDEMRTQLDRLGLDLDRDKEYFTMDENSSRAVHVAFKKLFDLGIIYRSEKLVYWSEELQSTLSDIEVEKVDGIERYVRTGEIIERRNLSQWFIDAKELARRSVDVVERGDINIIPPNYKKSWSSWLLENGVKDWCISRQSWWGHRIPAYKKNSSPDVRSNWVVADSIDQARSLLKDNHDIIQDSDVLDTWFSSSLLPLTVSGWPDTEKFTSSCQKGYFPLTVMETGYDILTYWVSKMVMMSLALTNQIPFKLILLHGMICDSDGKKMSKSRGNVIDPLDVMNGATLDELQSRTLESFSQGMMEGSKLNSILKNQQRLFPKGIPPCGADGLRAYALSHDFQEEVVRVRIEQIEKVRRLSNKIWNVYRFFLNIIDTQENKPQIEDFKVKNLQLINLSSNDKTILAKLSKCVNISHEAFHETYYLHHSFNSLEFFWTVELSQGYIENVKDLLLCNSGTKEEQRQALRVLGTCLLESTKLLHPFMPHLTEFLYQKVKYDMKVTEGTSVELSIPLKYERYPNLEDWAILAETQPSALSREQQSGTSERLEYN